MAKKKPARDASKWVKQTTFRLGEETLDDLELIKDRWTEITGVPYTRTDVIRGLAKQEVDRLDKRK